MEPIIDNNNLLIKALELHKQNKLQEAQSLYVDILQVDPCNEIALYYYAQLCFQNGQNEESIKYLSKAFELNPNYDYLLDLANIYLDCNERDMAIKVYNDYLKLYPTNLQAIYDLGVLYFQEGLYSKTIDIIKKGVELSPDIFELNYILAQSLDKCGYLDLACTFYIKSNELRPNNWEVLYQIGLIYHFKSEYEKALEYFNLAMKHNPNNIRLLNSIAASYQELGNWAEALNFYEKAYEIDPTNNILLYNYGRALIANKKIDKGLILYDEARIAHFPHHNLKFPTSIKPKWDGQNLQGKVIYVYTTAGIGDDILYTRYLPELQKLGAQIIAKPRNELVNLLRKNYSNIKIIDKSVSDDSLEFDYQIPFMSLGRAFKTNIDNIPNRQGYLKANYEKVKEYKDKYFDTDKHKIGICWNGSSGAPERNIPLEFFYKFAMLPNIKLYSLQKGEAENDLSRIPSNIEIINLGTTFADFTDTAAAIENLDLIITIDTSILHFAGAVGKTTWAIIPKNIWFWASEEDFTPWYDCITLYKQKNLGDWNEVVNRVYKNLEKHFKVF